jgi:hypothetical protein
VSQFADNVDSTASHTAIGIIQMLLCVCIYKWNGTKVK